MKSLLEYSDGEIALILVGGGVLAALIMCLGLCGLLHGLSPFNMLARDTQLSPRNLIEYTA